MVLCSGFARLPTLRNPAKTPWKSTSFREIHNHAETAAASDGNFAEVAIQLLFDAAVNPETSFLRFFEISHRQPKLTQIEEATRHSGQQFFIFAIANGLGLCIDLPAGNEGEIFTAIMPTMRMIATR